MGEEEEEGEGIGKEVLGGGAEESEVRRAERRGERRGVGCSDDVVGGRWSVAADELEEVGGGELEGGLDMAEEI